LADPQSTKQTLEITVPANEVEAETARVVESLQKKIRLPGFRPGKVPLDLIRHRYQEDVRHEVLEKLIPRHFFKKAEQEGLAVVGRPNVSEVKLEPGEPLRFKAEFEVAPTIELQGYQEVTIPYQDPEIADDDIAKRIEQLRKYNCSSIHNVNIANFWNARIYRDYQRRLRSVNGVGVLQWSVCVSELGKPKLVGNPGTSNCSSICYDRSCGCHDSDRFHNQWGRIHCHF